MPAVLERLMIVNALRRVEGGALSARRQCLVGTRFFLALYFLAILICHLAYADVVPDSSSAPVSDDSLSSATPPLSAAALAMAAAAERQTELREVPIATAEQLTTGNTAEQDGDGPTSTQQSPPLPHIEPSPEPFDADTMTVDSTTIPASITMEQQTPRVVDDVSQQSCTPQPHVLHSPFLHDDSCTPTATTTRNNSSTPSAFVNQSISTDPLDPFSTTTLESQPASTTPSQLPPDRDNVSASERVVEQKEKKNPIAELKEEVLKHIEEKKKEKEKEKKKEQFESDNNNNTSSSQNTQSTAATASVPTPASPSAPPAAPAVASIVPMPASPSVTPPSVSVNSPAVPATSAPPPLIYPSPPPSSISDRFNYAAYDSGAKLLLSSPGMKKASAILSSDDDSYMMTPCSSPSKYVIVQLKEDIQLDMIELINREHYSSSIQQFSLYGSNVYPADEWVPLGRFWADETQQAQYWRLEAGDYAVRYVKLIWETWWKDEYYCTLTQLGVYGRSVLEAFREDLDDSAEVLREVEQVLIEHNLAKEADMERKEVKDGAETTKAQEHAADDDVTLALTEGAIAVSSNPTSSSDPTSYLWDVVAFWTHQSSVDPVISQLMAVDEPPNIIVTAHSQSATPNGRLSISSPLLASSTDADELFGQPVCQSFNVSQPVTLLLPHLHASTASAISSASHPVVHTYDTIILVTEADSTESETASDKVGESVAEAVEQEEQGEADIVPEAAESDNGAQQQSSTVILPPSAATAVPAATSASSTTASLFSDFIYSQMARLSKQAGAQSQAEAEKIDPHYAALLAKYTGRDKKATQTASQSVTSTLPTDDPATASVAMPASASSTIADNVALVSAAEANKGKSSSHQSIFRTLTNRLKEVELHQALSTHFVSVLSERFGAEIEQLQTSLAKCKSSNALSVSGEAKSVAALEDREALREELKAEVRRELQEEMQRVLDMQQRMEQRLAEMSSANQSLHTLLHQELLAVVLVLAFWTVLSSLLSPLPLRAALWYLWRGVRVVVVWMAHSMWRVVVWLWRQATSGGSASGSTMAPDVPKPVHRRSSSADSSRRPSFSTPAIVPVAGNRQEDKAIAHSKNSQPPQQPLQQPQRPPQRPNNVNRPTNGHKQSHAQPQPHPLSQQSQPTTKRKSPPSSNPASPQQCTWTLDDAKAHTTKRSTPPVIISSQAVEDDDSFPDGEDAFSSWCLEAIDSGSARPHLSPPVTRAASPRRGSWSAQSAELEQRQQQQRRNGVVNNCTQPLPSRQPPSPLPPLRPTATAPSIARLTAKSRSRTAEAAHLPSFIRRAMSPPAASTAPVAAADSSSATPAAGIHPYVSHASINSFDVLAQSPDRRNRPLMAK